MKKKIIAVTCVLMLCLGLIGCGAEHADKPQELIREQHRGIMMASSGWG